MSNFINGTWVAAGGPEMRSYSPCETNLIWLGNESTEGDVNEAISGARRAFSEWSAKTLDQRITVLEAFASELASRRSELATTIHCETGKPEWEADTEVTAMINKVAISIRAYHERTGHSRNDNLELQHRAHGVMAVFGPYNFPGHLPNGHIVPALLAGNTVVFKPSEQTPTVAELTMKCWQAAGLPDGVINLVNGAKQTGVALVNGNIDGVLFTGSSLTGTAIHRSLGGRPEVIAALEMGGNNAIIVSPNSDPSHAAELVLQSAFLSAGQRCTCANRLILVESASNKAFIDCLVALMHRVIVDGAEDQSAEAFMGPVINRTTAESLISAQAALVDAGATALRTMAQLDEFGVRLSPGLIDVTQVENVPDEELFGPLLQLTRVSSMDDAISEANRTRYGLAAGLVSNNELEQHLFLTHIRAGVTSINAPTAGASSSLPFGGVGASGNHRPSAYYAADYAAWPQATMHGAASRSQSLIARGLAK
ncbi:succinylglutamate-semialdehyde dehydrogenase [Umboniibacter marinipuniceus]|uniref:Succinylglutamic semialdehyde dehydrogenase n=1 Tax=Umboniibacter marinipuniceus TaxID=569599 RepID=A0A3M0AEM7_9GAMM|nr:succinylglutamate-semialdehyde dehydrogenase [Umboniibacter marinipuniceus]RMA77642.1 succinylglutamic semialdehyde dehydrogenase [Umboniibacter marinipuniceus]